MLECTSDLTCDYPLSLHRPLQQYIKFIFLLFMCLDSLLLYLLGLASMCEDGGMVEGASQKDLQDVVELAIGIVQQGS